MAKKKRTTKSRVMIDLPKRPLAYVDAIFTINAKYEKLGEIRISQGGLDWYSRNARNPKQFGWTKLAKQLEASSCPLVCFVCESRGPPPRSN